MYEDEISLSDIVSKLWLRRGVLVVVPVLFIVGGIVYLLASMAAAGTTPTVYYVYLEAIEKGQYPSGAVFSPKDLIVPEVTAEVSRQTGVDAPDLDGAINAEFGTPAIAGIVAAYEKRLSTKGLSATDIERITAEFKDTLTRANERGVRITVDHDRLGISPEAGAAIATLIPAVWSKIFSERYRIFLDTSFPGLAVRPRMEELATTSQILDAQDQLDRLSEGLEAIRADERLSAITNASGQNAEDLLLEVNRFVTLFFQPIYSFAFSRNDEIARTYIRETEYGIAKINKQIANLNDTVDEIVRFNSEGKAVSSGGVLTGKRDSIQLGEDSLTQIIGLATKASLTDYLRQILEERHQLAVERAEHETRLAWTNGPREGLVSDDFREKAVIVLNEILASYAGLLNNVRHRLAGRYSELYRPAGAPFARASNLSARAPIVLALAAITGIVAAVLISLAIPRRRQELQTQGIGEEGNVTELEVQQDRRQARRIGEKAVFES